MSEKNILITKNQTSKNSLVDCLQHSSKYSIIQEEIGESTKEEKIDDPPCTKKCLEIFETNEKKKWLPRVTAYCTSKYFFLFT